ncbi:MAG: hypothetical protein R2847_01030 [Bacteroidia bacterium]
MAVVLVFEFDFTFFIFRLDIGVPIVDPQYGNGENVVVDNLKFRSLIQTSVRGYPFEKIYQSRKSSRARLSFFVGRPSP